MSVFARAFCVGRSARRAIRLAAAAVFALLLGPVASAQQVEIPPVIRIIIPFTPGGSNDLVARAIANQLGPRLKVTVIAENRPGASGWIGTKQVAEGPKDGSTLLSYTLSILTNAATAANPPVDVMKSLVPVSILTEVPLLVVSSAKSGLRTPAQLMAAARAKAGAITYSSGGSGTIAHLAGELLQDLAKVELRHIPYKGGSSADLDVVAGHIDMTMGAPATLAPLLAGGKLNLVAVTTPQPSSAFPGTPTMASVVPGYDASVWTAIWTPAGTPSALVQRFNREMNDIAKTKEFEPLLVGAVRMDLTPAEALDKARRTYTMWKEIATKKNIVVN